MLLIVMEPVGWSADEFKLIDEDSESESESESDDDEEVTKGYSKDKDRYKKILSEDELLPE
jgi:hypothetical protein